MKQRKHFLIVISCFILALFSSTYSKDKDKGYQNGLTLSEVFMIASADNEIGAVQFCTKEGEPLWGICVWIGYISPGFEGFDCWNMGPDCWLCDCDGTWVMEM